MWYSLDDINTTIQYEITPEASAYIAKGIFINVYGEDYVEGHIFDVFDCSEQEQDLEKYGKFYEVSMTKPGRTDGPVVVVSKNDGRILKVYSSG